MSLRPLTPRRETPKICMDTSETRRGLDGCDQCHTNPDELLLKFVWMQAKPGGYWTNMAIFTENPPGIGRIWPFSHETRRGLDGYGHFHAKPGKDGTNMAIFAEIPAGIGRIWPYSPKTRRGLDRYGHFHAKPAEDWTDMVIFTENPAGMG